MGEMVETGSSARLRARRRRATITLVLVGLLMFFAFWYAYAYYRDSTASGSRTAATCASQKSPTLAKVTLNVYNATSRNGLAAATAKSLRDRGLTVATVSNDPLDKTIKGTAEVRHGKSGFTSAKAVVQLVAGARRIQDGRSDASVDLVLGNAFTSLAPVGHKAGGPGSACS